MVFLLPVLGIGDLPPFWEKFPNNVFFFFWKRTLSSRYPVFMRTSVQAKCRLRTPLENPNKEMGKLGVHTWKYFSGGEIHFIVDKGVRGCSLWAIAKCQLWEFVKVKFCVKIENLGILVEHIQCPRIQVPPGDWKFFLSHKSCVSESSPYVKTCSYFTILG